MQNTFFNLWITGISGSGKTTLAVKLSKYFETLNHSHEVLDGDVYRSILSPSAGYTEKERNEFREKVIFIAKLLNKHGVSCIIPLLSSSREVREFARSELNNFVEIYLKCPLEVCIRRDPKGIYQSARLNNDVNVVGIDIPYEEPDSPELIIETDKQTINSSINLILEKLKELHYA